MRFQLAGVAPGQADITILVAELAVVCSIAAAAGYYFHTALIIVIIGVSSLESV